MEWTPPIFSPLRRKVQNRAKTSELSEGGHSYASQRRWARHLQTGLSTPWCIGGRKSGATQTTPTGAGCRLHGATSPVLDRHRSGCRSTLLARVLQQYGHEVKLISPQYVKLSN